MRNLISKIYIRLWGIKESFKNDLRKLGDYLQFVTPMIVLIYTSWFGDSQVGKIFVIYYLICTFIQVLLKSLFNNPRPNEVNNNVTINPNLNLDWSINEGDSFPSGHTMSAMSGGIFWFKIPFFQPYLGFIGILLGLITAISRVVSKSHWIRDVVTSSVIAFLLYYFIV